MIMGDRATGDYSLLSPRGPDERRAGTPTRAKSIFALAH
jgi:hypothetical protein